MLTSHFIQRDAPKAIRAQLREVMANGQAVRSELPDGWTADSGVAAVTVTGDGTPHHGRATSTENVRVAVYARHEPTVRNMATQIDAWLLNPANVRGFRISPGPGLVCARDAATKGWVAAVTVVAESTKHER
ncbi:hypothetical protein [Corynebacterium ulceribovis]|uniref:hypothetical protein n=1 Tax=Corynebacterium ulceribovis TaxID=487732 RepID=UPI000381B5E5|nr:hypothetical protein [Corynebacterium ulceribovis]